MLPDFSKPIKKDIVKITNPYATIWTEENANMVFTKEDPNNKEKDSKRWEDAFDFKIDEI